VVLALVGLLDLRASDAVRLQQRVELPLLDSIKQVAEYFMVRVHLLLAELHERFVHTGHTEVLGANGVPTAAVAGLLQSAASVDGLATPHLLEYG
jgi:hypothetical protein